MRLKRSREIEEIHGVDPHARLRLLWDPRTYDDFFTVSSPVRPVPKPVILRSKKYMAWIRTLPCIIPRCPNPSDAHHAGGLEAGRGKDFKGSDFRCLPFCRTHHNETHWGKERFARIYGLDLWLAMIERLEAYAYKLERRDRAGGEE